MEYNASVKGAHVWGQSGVFALNNPALMKPDPLAINRRVQTEATVKWMLQLNVRPQRDLLKLLSADALHV